MRKPHQACDPFVECHQDAARTFGSFYYFIVRSPGEALAINGVCGVAEMHKII
jgi:hypothetical protein